jgi:hypothetical protein
VRREFRERLPGERPRRAGEEGAILPQKIVREQRDVVLSLREGGDAQGEDVQPVEEVLPERSVRHHLPQVAVGGRDDPPAEFPRLVRAHGGVLPLLQDPQQLGLQLEGRVADFVEEEGAVHGGGHLPLAGALRPGKRALLVAEELRLLEVAGDRRDVHRHEGALAPSQVVDAPRDQFLPHAALAQQQDGGVRARHLPHALEQFEEDAALPDDPGGSPLLLLPGSKGAFAGGCLARDLPEQPFDAGQVERLGDELRGAGAGGPCGDLGPPHGGHDEEAGRRLAGLRALEHLDPFHAGHADVDESRRVRVFLQEGKRLFSVPGEVRGESHPRDGLLENPADALVVVGDQDSLHGAAFLPGPAGRDIFTEVPTPGEERISSFPPRRVTACRAITSPSPVPRDLVV